MLSHAIVRAGFPGPDFIFDTYKNQIPFETQDKAQILSFLRALANVNITGNNINQLQFPIANVIGVTKSQPEALTNEDRLKNIEFEDKQIPIEFRCAISLSIMTDPVYNRDIAQQKYDRSNIELWLDVNRQDLFYRSHLWGN